MPACDTQHKHQVKDFALKIHVTYLYILHGFMRTFFILFSQIVGRRTSRDLKYSTQKQNIIMQARTSIIARKASSLHWTEAKICTLFYPVFITWDNVTWVSTFYLKSQQKCKENPTITSCTATSKQSTSSCTSGKYILNSSYAIQSKLIRHPIAHAY